MLCCNFSQVVMRFRLAWYAATAVAPTASESAGGRMLEKSLSRAMVNSGMVISSIFSHVSYPVLWSKNR